MDTNVFADVVKSTFTPTGDFKEDRDRAEAYSKSVKMDESNTKIAVVAATQGFDTAAKTMINQFTDASGNFDYAAMRQMYG